MCQDFHLCQKPREIVHLVWDFCSPDHPLRPSCLLLYNRSQFSICRSYSELSLSLSFPYSCSSVRLVALSIVSWNLAMDVISQSFKFLLRCKFHFCPVHKSAADASCASLRLCSSENAYLSVSCPHQMTFQKATFSPLPTLHFVLSLTSSHKILIDLHTPQS